MNNDVNEAALAVLQQIEIVRDKIERSGDEDMLSESTNEALCELGELAAVLESKLTKQPT